MRKTLMVVAVVAATLAFIGPSTATGQQVGYASCAITTDPTSANPGDTITISGTGLQPNFTTTARIGGIDVGTATTDATGAFSKDFIVPTTLPPGPAVVAVFCDDEVNGAHVSSSTLTVTDPTATTAPPTSEPADVGSTDGGSSDLPSTGSNDTQPLVLLGAVAVVGGAALVLIARRRRGGSA